VLAIIEERDTIANELLSFASIIVLAAMNE
jgi:hypothetical protein